MDDTERFEMAQSEDEELERELAAYASARLSPDRWASARMRVAVIEQAAAQAVAAAPRSPGVLASLRLGLRRLAPVALVAALAITIGTTAGVAATPGGPLYGLRLQIETALLPSNRDQRFDAQQGQLGERLDEITGAVGKGDVNAADAAAAALSNEIDQTVSTASQNRADLLQLRATLVRQLGHLQGLVRPNDRSATNLQKLIAKTRAAISDVDQQLAALPSP